MCKHQERPDLREPRNASCMNIQRNTEQMLETREPDVKVNGESSQPKAQTKPLAPKRGQKATRAAAEANPRHSAGAVLKVTCSYGEMPERWAPGWQVGRGQAQLSPSGLGNNLPAHTLLCSCAGTRSSSLYRAFSFLFFPPLKLATENKFPELRKSFQLAEKSKRLRGRNYRLAPCFL